VLTVSAECSIENRVKSSGRNISTKSPVPKKSISRGIKSPLADKVYVIRRLPDMQEPVVIQVSMARAKRNGRENLRLAPGDLVSVEATPATMISDTVSSFFRVGLGLSGNIMAF
jgi:polysaccharide biosynthesis/export protein